MKNVTTDEARAVIGEIVKNIHEELVSSNTLHASAIFNPLDVTSNADAVQRIRHRIDSCITALQLMTRGESIGMQNYKIKRLAQYCILLLAADTIHYRRVALEAAKVADLEQQASAKPTAVRISVGLRNAKPLAPARINRAKKSAKPAAKRGRK
jgi:hypothetical protein